MDVNYNRLTDDLRAAYADHLLTEEIRPTGLTFHFVYDERRRCVETWGDYPGQADPSLAVLMGDLFGPGLKEQSQKPVSEVMSPIKVTVDAEAPIAKALFLMIKENVGMMPVMQANKVTGMIRLSDLFNEVSKLVLGD